MYIYVCICIYRCIIYIYTLPYILPRFDNNPWFRVQQGFGKETLIKPTLLKNWKTKWIRQLQHLPWSMSKLAPLRLNSGGGVQFHRWRGVNSHKKNGGKNRRYSCPERTIFVWVLSGTTYVHVTLGLHRRIEFLSAAEEEWESSGEDTRRAAINTETDDRCVPQFLGC